MSTCCRSRSRCRLRRDRVSAERERESCASLNDASHCHRCSPPGAGARPTSALRADLAPPKLTVILTSAPATGGRGSIIISSCPCHQVKGNNQSVRVKKGLRGVRCWACSRRARMQRPRAVVGEEGILTRYEIAPPPAPRRDDLQTNPSCSNSSSCSSSSSGSSGS